MLNQQIISNKPQRKSSRRSLLEGERLDRRRMARGEEREALALEGGEKALSQLGPTLVCTITFLVSVTCTASYLW